MGAASFRQKSMQSSCQPPPLLDVYKKGWGLEACLNLGWVGTSKPPLDPRPLIHNASSFPAHMSLVHIKCGVQG